MANLNWTTTAANTGILHDLICGASLFYDPISDDNWAADFYWWRIINPSAGAYEVPQGYTGISLPAGKYWIRVRAWETYGNDGTQIGSGTTSDGKTIIFYEGGSLYGTTPGDGIYLDQFDVSFTAAGVSAEIINVTASLTAG